ncbi:hypothetical protein KAR91_12525 [Candidatus Pacearchaeota archaeon]|nr:hypothetical protein [Candidatus Pacearchaeota archaeon]
MPLIRRTGATGATASELEARKLSRQRTLNIRNRGQVPEGLRVPEFDKGRVRSLQQEIIAPQLSGLRREVQRIGAGRFRTPGERREALRGGLRGAGEAQAAIQVGGFREAQGLRQAEFNRKLMEYQRQQRELEREQQLQEREEESRLFAARDITPSGALEAASLRMATRPGFDDTGGLRQPAIARGGATAAERRRIEEEGLSELYALAGGQPSNVQQSLMEVF